MAHVELHPLELKLSIAVNPKVGFYWHFSSNKQTTIIYFVTDFGVKLIVRGVTIPLVPYYISSKIPQERIRPAVFSDSELLHSLITFLLKDDLLTD